MLFFYGTRQYGKRNVVNRTGTCDQCGAHGTLSPYDSSSFFHVYWIPLIPLGSKRIIDACPSCERHYESKLKSYNKARAQELDGAIAAVEEDPGNAEKAAEAVSACIRYTELEQLKKIAPDIAARHARSPKVQRILGAANQYLGKLTEAEQFYRKAVELQGSPDNREALAVNLIQQLRPREAEHFLTHILSDKDKEKVGNFYYLIEAYRHLGKHEDALRILGVIESVDETLSQDVEVS